MVIDHFGFLTKDLIRSINSFQTLGYELISRQIDELRQVEIAFVKSESNEIVELIMPVASDSVVHKLIEKYNNTLYHICYKCGNVDNEIERLAKQGFMLIDSPKPAVAFGNRKVAFMYSSFAGMVELYEAVV